MQLFLTIGKYFLIFTLLASSVAHIFYGQISDGFIPDFLPKQAVHIAAAIVETATAIAMLLPRYSRYGNGACLILMLAFLPLHTVDLFADAPVVGSTMAAAIRLGVQFLFVFWAYQLAMQSTKKIIES